MSTLSSPQFSMDWDRIEADLQAQTEAHWSNGSQGQVALRNIENLPLPPPRTAEGGLSTRVSKFGDMQGEFGLNYVVKELRDLREHSYRQAEKLSAYEKLLVSQGTLAETVNNDLLNRVVHLEKLSESGSIISTDIDTANTRFIKENYDAMIYDRLGKLEETMSKLQERMGGDDVVGDLGKLMSTSLDHITALGSLTEKTKKKSDQAVALLEAVFQALASLGGGGEDDFGMDLVAQLSSMQGENQQADRIKHLIMDSLQRVVDKSIRGQVGAAIECLGDLFSPQLRGVEADLRIKVEDVETNMKMAFDAVYERLQHDEKRISDNQAKLSQAESNSLVSVASAKALKETVSGLSEEMRGTRSLLRDQKEMLDVLTLRDGGSGGGGGARSTAVTEGEIMAIREDLKRLQGALDKSTEHQHSTRSDVDDLRFDLTQTIEKGHLREGELKVRMDDIRDDAREGTTKLKAQVQGLVEQQLGELTRKFNKLEGKFDKNDRKRDGGVAAPMTTVEQAALGPEVKALEETSKELSEGLDGIRQNIANVTFDLDDLRHAVKALEKEDSVVPAGASEPVPGGGGSDQSELEGRMLRVEESVATLREAMDALQDEIVMLAQPPDVSGGAGGHVDEDNTDNIDLRQVDKKEEEKRDLKKVKVQGMGAEEKCKIPIGTKTVAPSRLDQQQQSELGDGKERAEDFPVGNKKRGKEATPKASPTAKMSMGIELSSSDSSFSASSDEDSDEEDIIGTMPKQSTSTKQVETLSPSDVLAEQLRIKADFERKEALRRVQSKGAAKSPQKVSGPPISAASSAEPIVSGSLLGGGGRRSKTSGILPASSTGDHTPLFETLAADVDAFEPSKPGTATVSKEHVPVEAPSRKDTIQCSHCLRRIAKVDITVHSKSCELRTELCRNGCGAKILVMKMEQHLLTCPKK